MKEYSDEDLDARYDLLEKDLEQKGVDSDQVKKRIYDFKVEIPSWVFGEFGAGRFSGYVPPAAARNVYEKFDDAAFVNKLTGATPKVAVHAGWDNPDNAPTDEATSISFKKLKNYAQKKGLEIGTVSPTYFLEGTEWGSLSSDDSRIRDRFIQHSLLSGLIM